MWPCTNIKPIKTSQYSKLIGCKKSQYTVSIFYLVTITKPESYIGGLNFINDKSLSVGRISPIAIVFNEESEVTNY